MLILFLIIAIIVFIVCLPHIFTTYTDMEYVKHLEDMGVFVDENGKQI
jgi:hypothetical protein